MRRFFLPAGSLAGETITLTGAEAHHIARVLRLRPGRAVEFFDGHGSIVTAVLTDCDSRLVTARKWARSSGRCQGSALPWPITRLFAMAAMRISSINTSRGEPIGRPGPGRADSREPDILPNI